MSKNEKSARSGFAASWSSKLMGAVLCLIGVTLTGGGTWLLWLGGSAYYLLAGLACVVSAWFYVTGRERRGLWLFLVMLLVTCIWAFAEVGSEFWQLLPRIAGPAFFGVFLLFHYWLSVSGRRLLGWGAAGGGLLALLILLGVMRHMPETTGGLLSGSVAAEAAQDWTAFGQSQAGARYSPAAQITPENVGSLELAWSFRTGDMPEAYPQFQTPHSFQATPLKVGNLVYFCTQHDVIFALDADSGEQKWRHDPQVDQTGVMSLACRGVSYTKTSEDTQSCAQRIIFGTLDSRLIALDALTGKPCEDFGEGGEVGLKDGLGVTPDGHYMVSSPPAIANGVAVIGGFVLDGLQTDMPSGVVRGYDVVSGERLWSWDSGAIDENWQPGPGEHFTRGSPNSWTVMSADPELGLVYVPMGNATPDYVGMHRTPEHDRYSSAVVALDSRTGKRRWHFRTVHHDLWDYDIGSQPVLFDMPMPGGSTVPALAQPTKQGDIYILDRRTGTPLTEVIERPVPKGDIPEERYSPTQPVSVGFPSPLPQETLREKDMWGMTPIDQLYCRIRFRSADYTGRYTPPSTKRTIQYPSNLGVMDWGSATIGDGGKTLFVNSSEVALVVQLLPQEVVEKKGQPSNVFFSPQFGTPYAANPEVMLSPLGVPCNAPPWGRLTAIDLASRTIKWQHPLGTSRDHAPLDIAVPGAPSIAGSVATAGGLLFIGATMDDYFRAFDTRSGEELWRFRLPAGGQAGPISYVSDKTGRQYVVISAGGHHLLRTKKGDYVMAFALPRSEN